MIEGSVSAPEYSGRPVTRLLVVDDDRVTNRILQAQLEARGYEVDSASDGEQALEQSARFHPDLLFLDVAMPGIGGLEVLERLKGQGPDLAVIMMTAYGTEEVAIEALRRGADDYLRKPFDPAEFEAVLERTVARLRLSRQNVALRRQLDEKRRQLEVELARAARVQAELLPNTVPELEGFDLAARFVPAREVGGDFYDWMHTEPDNFTLTLGDVMGKGMPAALLMATARAVVRALIQGNPPAVAMNLAARALEGDLLRAASFLTLFHARLDVVARHVSYVDAGHGHVFVRRADGTLEGPEEGGIPLGILPDEVYKEGSFVFGTGDALVVYSDGLVDAHPGSTLDVATIAAHLQGATGASEMVDRLIQLADPTDSPPDDLTAMVLYCREGA